MRLSCCVIGRTEKKRAAGKAAGGRAGVGVTQKRENCVRVADSYDPAPPAPSIP